MALYIDYTMQGYIFFISLSGTGRNPVKEEGTERGSVRSHMTGQENVIIGMIGIIGTVTGPEIRTGIENEIETMAGTENVTVIGDVIGTVTENEIAIVAVIEREIVIRKVITLEKEREIMKGTMLTMTVAVPLRRSPKRFMLMLSIAEAEVVIESGIMIMPIKGMIQGGMTNLSMDTGGRTMSMSTIGDSTDIQMSKLMIIINMLIVIVTAMITWGRTTTIMIATTAAQIGRTLGSMTTKERYSPLLEVPVL